MIEVNFSLDKIENFNANYYVHDESKIMQGRVFPAHIADTIEFYVLFEGDVSFSVENRVYKVSPFDVVVTKPNQIHNCILNSNSPHKHACFWFDVNNEFIFKKFLEMDTNLISPNEKDLEKLKEIYKRLGSEKENNELTRFSLLVSMLEIFSKNISASEKSQKIPLILEEILNDLNENFIEINSLSYFTKKYNISSSTLNRLFTENLSVSPKLYLETKRLAYARTLLKDGCSVMDACDKAGFPDYSNFIRLFKKRFNVTPNQYKRKK